MRTTTFAGCIGALAILLSAGVVSAVQEDPTAAPAPAPARKPLYEASADASAQITSALKQATKENRRVLIQWGAEWCGWCHKLSDCFKKTSKISRLIRYDYDLVRVDVGRFDKNVALGEKYGAKWKEEGIPYLTILSADGTVLANQETGSLESGPNHEPAKVLAFLEKYKPTPRSANTVLENALGKAKSEDKTVFLHFGAPWCGWCHRFEAWLSLKDVVKIMNEHFVEVKIDTDRDEGGEALHKRYTGGQSTGIPWFVVLAADGTVLTTSDGPDGNVGCPWTEEEVKTFGAILARSKSGVSAQQIAQLEKSLVTFRTKTEKKK